MRLGSYADTPEFTGMNAVMEEVAKRLTLSDDEVGLPKEISYANVSHG